ncbi:hypothetical protein [Alishewanella aestuarii]|uniref:hypothetical protein n=1 Tax=Alishewanella aestuarii TaxID=453835 RepID=UPI0012EA49B5|nr:hypothetical protein [Alishewanella aestuarii]
MSDEKKPRSEIITFETKGTVSKITVVYDSVHGVFHFPEAEPKSLFLERSYQRNSGKPKVLTSMAARSNNASFDPDKFLQNNYDYAISIDTNTKQYKGHKISICTCYHVPKRLSAYGSDIPFSHLVSYVILSPIDGVNPEQIGWSLVIENNIRPAKNPSRIAVIVDSEKDALPNYNLREKPYFAEYYLPDNTTMHYASDKDRDSLAGQMLKMCHNAANQLHNYMLVNELSMPLLQNACEYHKGYFRVRVSQYK